jgi:hypothetical protein
MIEDSKALDSIFSQLHYIVIGHRKLRNNTKEGAEKEGCCCCHGIELPRDERTDVANTLLFLLLLCAALAGGRSFLAEHLDIPTWPQLFL